MHGQGCGDKTNGPTACHFVEMVVRCRWHGRRSASDTDRADSSEISVQRAHLALRTLRRKKQKLRKTVGMDGTAELLARHVFVVSLPSFALGVCQIADFFSLVEDSFFRSVGRFSASPS